MRYGCDLDGCLVDMHKGLADVVNSIWPGRIEPGNEVPTEWDLTSLGLSQSELGAVWSRIGDTRNWWMGLPAHRQNVDAVFRHRLMRPEDEIFYVTARTTRTPGLPIMHQSQRWLEMCGIGGLGTTVIVTAESKAKVYDLLDIQYAIDDALHVVEEGSQVIYLLDRPYNREGRSPGLDVVESLDEFFNLTKGDRK